MEPITPFCNLLPNADHRECPSSVECTVLALDDLPSAPVELTEQAIQSILTAALPGRRYLRVTRISRKNDRIQSFTVGPRNADAAGQVLAEAGYHVHHADEYVVHLIP